MKLSPTTQKRFPIFIALLIFFNIHSIAEGNTNSIQLTQDYVEGAIRKNQGQWRDEIKYIVKQENGQVTFLEKGISYTFRKQVPLETGDPIVDSQEEAFTNEYLVWNLDFVNALPTTTIIPEEEEIRNINYMIGNDFSRHVTGVRDYSMVNYQDVYEKISLKYYQLEDKQLKYDLIVEPGGDISEVQLRARGTNGFSIDRTGKLEVKTLWGTLLEDKPYSYQLINGVKQEVDVRFRLIDENTYGFEAVDGYNPNYRLIVDPIVFDFYTYLGFGTGSVPNQYPKDVVLDDDGYTYITGLINTYISEFITPGTYDDTHGGGRIDTYVAKVHPSGTKIEFATYLGGGQGDSGKGIGLDKDGNIYVTGWTQSHNFPTTTGSYQPKYKGTPYTTSNQTFWNNFLGGDVFVCKFSNDGKNLLYSTYVGGTSAEEPAGATGTVVTPEGEVYVSGYTMSDDFPTTAGAMQKTYAGGLTDGFVFKLDVTNNNMDFCTYWGGSGIENFSTPGTIKQEAHGISHRTTHQLDYHQRAGGLTVSDKGEVYVVGWTNSTDMPTSAGAYKSTRTGDIDAAILKLDANGSSLLRGTYVGGTDQVTGQGYGVYSQIVAAVGVEVDSQDRAYVTGICGVKNFPTTPGAYDPDPTRAGGADAFLLRMKPDFSGMEYSMLLGTPNTMNYGVEMSITPRNELYLLGQTRTTCHFDFITNCENVVNDFPTTCSVQPSAYNTSQENPFIMKFDESGNVLFSTMMGGTGYDYQVNMDINYNSPYSDCKEEIVVAYSSHSKSRFQTTTDGQRYHMVPITDNSYKKECEDRCFDILTVFKLKPELNLDFVNSPASCGSPVQFQSQSSGNCIYKAGPWNATSWFWDFGDGKVLKSNGHAGSDPVALADSYNGLITGTYENPRYTYNGSGTYTVIHGVGCPFDTIQKEIVIGGGASSIDLGPDKEVCGNLNETLTVGWQPSGSTIKWSTGETSESIQVTQPGTYSVTIGDGVCAAKDSITLSTIPDLVVTATATVKPTCSNPNGQATANVQNASGTYTYKWNNGQTTQTATGLAAGNYTVKVTNQSGCTGTASVVINTQPSFSISTTLSDIDGCDRQGAVNASATVTPTGGTPPYKYQWNDPQNQITQTATGLPVGTYQVVVTDAAGCSTVDVVTIEEVIQIDINVDLDPCESCSNGQVTATIGGTGTAPYTYRWDDDGQQTTMTATGLRPGVYTITVTDDKGCRGSAQVGIGGFTVGFEDISEATLNIYPNPATNQLFVELAGVESSLPADRDPVIQLIDQLGQRIQVQTTKLGNRYKLDLTGLASSVYFLYVEDNGRVYTQRVIKH